MGNADDYLAFHGNIKLCNYPNYKEKLMQKSKLGNVLVFGKKKPKVNEVKRILADHFQKVKMICDDIFNVWTEVHLYIPLTHFLI